MRPKTRWLRALALLPVGCTHSEAAPVTATPETVPATSATASSAPAEPSASVSTSTSSSTPASTSASVVTGCFCYRHKSDDQFSEGRPRCKVGELDFAGKVCTAGNPAEGPLPPPDLPA